MSLQLSSQQVLITNLEMGVKKNNYEMENVKSKIKENISDYSESTKPEVVRYQMAQRSNQILGLEEFADFNEQSLSDSYCSEDFGQSSRLNPFVNRLIDEELKNAIKRSNQGK